MHKKRSGRSGVVAVLTALAACGAMSVPALGQPASLTTAFTYQGELSDGGTPATGVYDLQFALFDSVGGAVGPVLCVDNVSVVGGHFTVNLDFGDVYGTHQRWLEIRVRPDTGQDCSITGGFTTLSPRQQLTATPFAMRAMKAGSADALGGQPASFYTSASSLSSGLLSDARLSSNVSLLGDVQTITGAKTFTNNTLLMRNSGNTFSTTLTAPGASAPRTLSLPDASGTLISTGNLSAITSVGTILTGSWSGTVIGVGYGGTGANLSASGGTGQYVKQTTVGGPMSVGTIAVADLPTTGGDLSGPYSGPTVTRLQGRIVASTAPTDAQVLKWNAAISQWQPATDASTTYLAGTGLTLVGTTFSLATGGVTGGAGGVVADGTITNADLASDGASLLKVSGGAMHTTGGRVGIGIAPAVGKELHVAGDAQVDGTVTIGTQTRTYSIGGFEFRDLRNTTTNGVSLQEATTAGGVICQGIAALHLPNGATITSITAYWTDTSANSATVYMDRWPVNGVTGGTTLGQVVSIGNSGATATVDSTIINAVVDNSTYIYLVRTDWTSTSTGDISLEGVVVTYTITTPLP